MSFPAFGTPAPPPAAEPASADPPGSGTRPRGLVLGLAAAGLLALAGAAVLTLGGTGDTVDLSTAPVVPVTAPEPATTPTAVPTLQEVSSVRDPFEALVIEAPQPAADPVAAEPSTTWPPPGTDPATLTDKGLGTASGVTAPTAGAARSTASSSSSTRSVTTVDVASACEESLDASDAVDQLGASAVRDGAWVDRGHDMGVHVQALRSLSETAPGEDLRALLRTLADSAGVWRERLLASAEINGEDSQRFYDAERAVRSHCSRELDPLAQGT